MIYIFIKTYLLNTFLAILDVSYLVAKSLIFQMKILLDLLIFIEDMASSFFDIKYILLLVVFQ